jgi:predicted Ser/Thr protein kinase/ribosomal protein L7/L12
LPEDAPEGLCPQCLARVALGTEPAAPGATININPLAEAAPGTRVPPDVAQLAAQFPQMEIIELLGMGGMGMVYKARQRRVDRLVALKILPVESSRGPYFAERFEREAKALAKLNHPGIVTFYDFGQTSDYYYFIMEYVDGMNLRQLLQSQTIEPRQALELVIQICTALQFAHDEGVVHRDIKPENILLNKKGQVKIADFGLAKLLGTAPDTALTMSQAAMGTMNYMAPEQRQNAQGVDHRADIYSLGVVFYEMLTGEVPMGRFEPPSKRVQVDVRLDEVVLRALEREPSRRYQQVSEVKSNVETITSTMPQAPAGPAAAPPPAQGAPTRFPYSDIFGVAMLFLALHFAYQAQQFTPLIGKLLFLAIPLLAIFALHARKQIQQARERGLWPLLGERATLEHVKGLAQAGEKKLAIKLYRQILHGVPAADAKAAVETLTSTPPATLAPVNVSPTRFPYSDIFSVAMFLLALYAANSAFDLLLHVLYATKDGSSLSRLIVLQGIFLAGIWKGTRFTLERWQIQQAGEKGLWPLLGERATLEHVKGLAQAGQKKLAIKLYRQIHVVSSADAKAAVKKLAGEAKGNTETLTSKMPKAPAAPPEASKAQRLPGFVAYFLKPSRAWVLACVVGAFSGFAPEWSYTTRYWGLWVDDGPNASVQVLKVASGSPAERTGFTVDDVMKEPASYASLSQAFDRVRKGDKRTFTVRRGGQEVRLDASAGPNQVAVVWYANRWYPIAGALFICVGIIVFATAPVAPPPLWRSISVAIAGLGIAIGFAVAVAGDGVFPRFAVYERWIFVPTRNEWCGLQGLIGMTAAVLVTILGATEIRQRLRKPPEPAGSVK